MTGEKKSLLTHLIRQEFDAIETRPIPSYIKHDRSMELVELANELKLDDLVKELKSDLRIK